MGRSPRLAAGLASRQWRHIAMPNRTARMGTHHCTIWSAAVNPATSGPRAKEVERIDVARRHLERLRR